MLPAPHMSMDRSDILDFLHGLYRLQTVGSLSEFICSGLPTIIDSENAILCGHDGRQRVITSVVARHPFSRANLMPHINESGLMARHPLWENIFDPVQPVRSLSDTTSRRDWHRHPLYGEVFAPDGIEDQLNVEVLGTPDQFTTINILRAKRGFTADERALFARLRPHFAQALINASLAEKAGLVQPPCDDAWTLAVDQHGRLTTPEATSEALIVRHFGKGGRLPAEVEHWIVATTARLNQGWLETRLAPLRVHYAKAEWHFTLHRTFDDAAYRLSVNRCHPAPARTRISPRECEILHWLCAGKSNEEIACILDVSINTVKSHLKHCFAKLGVENRVAAANKWQRRQG
jgi:DNA-binding CsgD family transcriptional regulator